MAGSSKRVEVVVLMWAAALMWAGSIANDKEMLFVEGAVTCGTVVQSLGPCVPYLTGPAADPPASCCNGVRSLYSMTRSSRPDRVAACECIKGQSKALGSRLQSSKVGGLPGKCSVVLGYTLSTTTNCKTIP